MKLVTTIGRITGRVGEEKALKMIANAGFDGYDFSMFCPVVEKMLLKSNVQEIAEYGKKIKKYADGLHLPCLQAHAPFYDIPTEMSVDGYVDVLVKSVVLAESVGCDRIVAHPANWFSAQENYEKIYRKVLSVAERAGVTVLTENMYNWKDEKCQETIPTACGTAKDFIEHIDLVNSEYFKGCLDIGHAMMQNCEGPVAMIKAMGADRIKALHVHDVDGINDNHTFPFCENGDWNAITAALKEIGYTGHFTFEADAFMRNYPNELLSACLTLLEKTGRYLIAKIED